MRTARTDSMWNRARVLGGSAVLLLMITLASNAQAYCPEPPPGQAFEDFYHSLVRVYTGTNFTGICQMLPPVTIANLGAPRVHLAGDFNNAIRSIKVGRSARLRLFDGTAFSGVWAWWETSSPDLGEWNARASSLRVEDRAIKPDCSNLPFNTVAIYQHSDFRGDCRVLSPGAYIAGLGEMGFKNDSISSVRNRAGQIWLYDSWNWREGRFDILEEGWDYEYVGDYMNDKTTNIFITNHSSVGQD
jgi:hypothetical protein